MKPFTFRYYDISHFSLFLNGKEIPSVCMHLDTGREKSTVMGYLTLFEASGIRHSSMEIKKHMIYT
jgi:hypothetical protein